MKKSTTLEDFNPFSLPQIRDFVQVYSYYKRAGIPIESILKKYDKWLSKLQKQLKKDPWAKESKALNKEAIDYCPKCKKPMDLLDVSNLKGDDNLFGWKSVLSCRHCGHEEFSEEVYAIRAKRRIERIVIKQREMRDSKAFAKFGVEPLCPECGKKIILRSITLPQGKNNVYGWRSVVECTNCTYQLFSKLKIEQRRTKINRARRII